MANSGNIKVDLKQVENLGEEYEQMAEALGERLVDAGIRLVRAEVPKVTKNLFQGISGNFDKATMRGEVVAAAQTGRVGVEQGELHLPSGATREITLRAQPAYDYARAVAEGTGVYATGGVFGPQPAIRPRVAKALLIPVGSVPVAVNGKPQSYITSNGKIYVLRRYQRGRKPDAYHVRAAQRLEVEVPAIFDRVVSAFANQEKEL